VRGNSGPSAEAAAAAAHSSAAKTAKKQQTNQPPPKKGWETVHVNTHYILVLVWLPLVFWFVRSVRWRWRPQRRSKGRPVRRRLVRRGQRESRARARYTHTRQSGQMRRRVRRERTDWDAMRCVVPVFPVSLSSASSAAGVSSARRPGQGSAAEGSTRAEAGEGRGAENGTEDCSCRVCEWRRRY
jgi:hypothetical protein